MKYFTSYQTAVHMCVNGLYKQTMTKIHVKQPTSVREPIYSKINVLLAALVKLLDHMGKDVVV